ncbi:hypothetical protein STAPHY8AQ_20342 [Staphylococcus sp. 8AQ]|nr:hypothetical protein STAPHY8AQ_20342 [Staphylococcus sp. 8AQ]
MLFFVFLLYQIPVNHQVFSSLLSQTVLIKFILKWLKLMFLIHYDVIISKISLSINLFAKLNEHFNLCF